MKLFDINFVIANNNYICIDFIYITSCKFKKLLKLFCVRIRQSMDNTKNVAKCGKLKYKSVAYFYNI